MKKEFIGLEQSVTNIFEYSNIFDPNIYSDIRSYRDFDTNIFGYSFVSKMFIRIYSDTRSCHFLDTNIFRYSFMSKSIQNVTLCSVHGILSESENKSSRR